MLRLFVFCLSLRGFVEAVASGACYCVTANSVNVRDAAGLSTNVVTSVSSGECYHTTGSSTTKDGYTWYQLQTVKGHSNVWVASDYLQSSSSGCSTSSSSGSFATGLVSQHCLQCICQQESGCRNLACAQDVGSLSCGYFQIKEAYWIDCGEIGGSWKACAADKTCASQCVQNYMKRYAAHYDCPMTCEGYAREHNGGPNGCHHSSTLSYWNAVQSHSGCSGVH